VQRLVLIACLLGAAGCDIQPFVLGGGGGGGGDGDGGVPDGGTGDDGGATPPDAATCIPTGPDDTCDEVDNDCNGIVDDAFDKQNDGNNCGICGMRCTAPGAIMGCEMGACVFVECQPGFADFDVNAPGCEYQCPLFPPGSEDCNGVDDDCDNMVDEAASLLPPPTGLCRNTPNTACAGVTMICDTRGTQTRWFCDYPASVEFDPSIPNGITLEEALCDGEDGDCDGVADDPFTDLGQECDNGAPGICRDVGERRCDPADTSQTFCDLTVLPDPIGAATAETCNGLDDNCDGIVDNPTGPDRVIDDMVHITHSGNDFYVYTYEAARPDSTSTTTGTKVARSCSKPNVLPWPGATFSVATAACAISGKRLCTSDEYLAACEGAAGNRYPYGDVFEATTCNAEPLDGVPGGADDDVLLATGSLAMCTSDDAVFDLSGNLKEWTDDITGQTPGGTNIAVLRGGAFDTPSHGATCDFRTSRAAVDTILPTIGFRCCSDSAP
jgi:hypothetical protein